MRKLAVLFMVLASGMLGLMLPSGAGANPIQAGHLDTTHTFSLNCVLSTNFCTGPVPSFGTVTFEDNGPILDSVDITVDLTGAGVHKVLSFFFNYDTALYGSDAPFAITGTGAITVGDNDQFLVPNRMAFDIQILPDPSDFEPYTTTISLPGFDLEPTDFHFFAENDGSVGGGGNPCPGDASDTACLSWVGVHIGNIFCEDQPAGDCTPGRGGEDSQTSDSIKVGSLVGPGGTDINVPEPATLLLLGSGLTGLAIWRRRKSS